MKYEEFANSFMDLLKQNYPSDTEITRHDVLKSNGVVLDGVTVKQAGASIAPTIYLDGLFEKYEKGYGIPQIVEDAVKAVNAHLNATIKLPELTRESAKIHLYCVVVNYEKNKEMLKDTPYEVICKDLAVIPRFRVGEDGSFLVRNSVCEALMMTPEEVMELAHSNTDKEVYSCKSLQEVLFGLMSNSDLSEDFLDDVMTEGQECMMYVLTNERKYDGAAAISSPKALKDAFEKIGPYYILPSSRHELILVPEKVVTDVRDIESIVREINQSSVSEEDFLSDSIFHFEGKNLTRVDSQAETMGETMSETFEKVLADAPVMSHAHAH